MLKKFTLITAGLMIAGCSSMNQVRYEDVETTNRVRLTLYDGSTVSGSVTDAQPYRLEVLESDGKKSAVNANEIKKVERKTPVYDDRGRGISEEEIAAHRKNKNSVVYGIGGGMLSLGTSFFAGSMLSQSANDGGTALTVTTAAGGGLGTLFFVRAGKALDRKQAIDNICQQRQSQPEPKKTDSPSLNELKEHMNQEKKKQESLRKEREELLRRLQDKQQRDE